MVTLDRAIAIGEGAVSVMGSGLRTVLLDERERGVRNYLSVNDESEVWLGQ